jgi:hypothetical protein
MLLRWTRGVWRWPRTAMHAYAGYLRSGRRPAAGALAGKAAVNLLHRVGAT